MKELVEALKPIREFVESNPYGTAHNDGTKLRTTNIRLDYDQEDKILSDNTWNKITLDLIDLIINGDFNQINREHLHYIDGVLKRGQTVKTITFPRAQMHRAYSINRRLWEFTIYLVLYVEFNE